MTELTAEQQLDIIRKAWGPHRGYVFFPWISGEITDVSERKRSWNEAKAFKWPQEKPEILDHMRSHTEDDLYWSPLVFDRPRRGKDFALEERCLWADLDEVNPSTLEEYPPTTAWETSPGRYQCLWLVSAGDMLGAAVSGGENQQMTYYVGADTSGWDLTQVLRIPGWKNFKPDHRGPNGEVPTGKLLWKNQRRYLPDSFEGLPEIGLKTPLDEVLESDIDKVDRLKVYSQIRLKLPQRARELYAAKSASGDRSINLWYLQRCLADVGCSASEIVAIVRPTVWNKFEGRDKELEQLIEQALKAIDARSDETAEALEKENLEAKIYDRTFINLFDAVNSAPKLHWIVEGLISRGSCGFIAGQPKTYKSWFALDLALSVATGQPFLDHFVVRHPGKVAFIQEEDGVRRIKRRLDKLWPSKQADKVQLGTDGEPEWVPAKQVTTNPDIDVLIGQGFVISNEGWQEWLDDQLKDAGYCLLILDPLMMIAGNVEENRAQDMTENVFKPLKQLAQKHDVAILLVHHLRKGDPKTPTRGGQLMLGSVANHAWSENSMYLQRSGRKLKVELENKDTLSGEFTVSGIFNEGWTPTVSNVKGDVDAPESPDESSIPPSRKRRPADPSANGTARRGRKPSNRALDALTELGPGAHSTLKIAEQMGISKQGASAQLTRLAEERKIQIDRGRNNLGQVKWHLITT